MAVLLFVLTQIGILGSESTSVRRASSWPRWRW